MFKSVKQGQKNIPVLLCEIFFFHRLKRPPIIDSQAELKEKIALLEVKDFPLGCVCSYTWYSDHWCLFPRH